MLFELWIAAISEDQRLRRGAQRQLRRHPGGRLLHDRRHVGREGEGGEAGRGGRRQVRGLSVGWQARRGLGTLLKSLDYARIVVYIIYATF